MDDFEQHYRLTFRIFLPIFPLTIILCFPEGVVFSSMREKVLVLSAYSVVHAVIDCACAMMFGYLLMSSLVSAVVFSTLIIAYNMIAFGLHTPAGMFIDKMTGARWGAASGAIAVCAGVLLLPYFPIAAVCIAGLGNAVFHVSGGTYSIAVTPGKATGPGLFIAPGAAGIFIGTFLGKLGNPPFLWIAVILFAGALFCARISPRFTSNIFAGGPRFSGKVYIPLGLALLFSILVRSLAGSAINSGWRVNVVMGIVLMVAAVAGKAFGGVIGDRFGWIQTGLVCVLVCAFLIGVLHANETAMVIAMVLVQATTGITLAAMFKLLRPYPATAFGICSLALLSGALPMFTSAKYILSRPLPITILIALSGVTLFLALRGLSNAEGKTVL